MTELDWMPPWLARLWELPGITDVLINGPGRVWVDRGIGLEPATDAAPWVTLPAQAEELRTLAVRLATAGGRRLDDAAPMVDARLPDGSRLHAVLPPVADGCALISLRRLRARGLGWEELAAGGTVHAELLPLLRGLVAERANVLITGATGSGKTTMLASLLGQVDPGERIVLIEEAGELGIGHPHVVRLLERRPNVDGAGAVDLGRLVREALRMRPDRIVLGECRGAELREVLLACNTGHRGALTTMHANGAADVPARLSALASLAGLSQEAAAMHAAAAFDVILQLERGGGVRRLAEVAILQSVAGVLKALVAARVDERGVLERGPAWEQLAVAAGMAGSLQARAAGLGRVA